MKHDFDLIVIGGGSGGLAGAFRAAEHGARVALLEPDALGGTCVNVGCVPKKAMWLAAEVARHLRMAGTLGFNACDARLDWPTFIAHRQRYIANIHASYRARLDASGIALLPRRGRFVDPSTIECDDGVRLTGRHVLIATGAHPRVPEIPGAEHGQTSDDFFNWIAPPERVAIVGGGYIAVELAGVLQALGSQVSLYVRGPRLMDGFDAELTAQLDADYRHAGVRIEYGHAVTSLGRGDDGRLHVKGAEPVAGDGFHAVLFATGRTPNSAHIGLDQAGVVTDARGHIVVDAHHATRAPGVHAVGDVTSDPALTPVAIAAARRLMDRLFDGAEGVFDCRHIPTVVFAHPPIGKVGLTEAEARAQFGATEIVVHRAAFRPMLEALADGQQRSLFKLVCHTDRRVLGLHLLGDGADEILQGFAVALKKGLTLDDLRDTVAIHPTSAEEIVLMR